ncbi:magnesium/cobalt transporter CorA [Lyngbya confervoides]|uniref:Magnesium transport protein CorA n=1 Tax=Lyngbya confervoides BDU141951 TaxID=1574623 RepID=A0ABD4T3F4_9CYAN|nr:magnesium/cobalt transporter CorA [Lyngbya confervoides]MCM1983346.1 magnesium/cobalt transporter CorA [Lyngbya confervoides BDU141951]
MTVQDIFDAQADNLEYFFDKPGSAPGTLRIRENAAPSQIYLTDYTPERSTRHTLQVPEDCRPFLESESVSWIDVQGLGSETTLKSIGEVFDLHPLVLEDVVNVPQRPKVEDYEDQLLIVTRMVTLRPQQEDYVIEQVSFILEPRSLLTVQEYAEHDCFNAVRMRIRRNKGVIRRMGTDYLAYALLDAIIDGYFPVLEQFGERIEALEEEVVDRPTPQTLAKIHQMKRELLVLRRTIWPQRDALTLLFRDGTDFISDEAQIYFRDCYDHTIQLLDMVETYRDLTSSLMEVYLSSVNNKMNEVMKTLTVISTIFIPLSFIAGVYGMNFNSQVSPLNMPELNWYWGYPAVWVLMITIAAGLVFFFWRRGWFHEFTHALPSAVSRETSQETRPRIFRSRKQ